MVAISDSEFGFFVFLASTSVFDGRISFDIGREFVGGFDEFSVPWRVEIGVVFGVDLVGAGEDRLAVEHDTGIKFVFRKPTNVLGPIGGNEAEYLGVHFVPFEVFDEVFQSVDGAFDGRDHVPGQHFR